jgi:hypothetical protein
MVINTSCPHLIVAANLEIIGYCPITLPWPNNCGGALRQAAAPHILRVQAEHDLHFHDAGYKMKQSVVSYRSLGWGGDRTTPHLRPRQRCHYSGEKFRWELVVFPHDKAMRNSPT